MERWKAVRGVIAQVAVALVIAGVVSGSRAVWVMAGTMVTLATAIWAVVLVKQHGASRRGIDPHA